MRLFMLIMFLENEPEKSNIKRSETNPLIQSQCLILNSKKMLKPL